MKFVRNTRSNRANLIVSVIYIYDNFNKFCSFTLFISKSLNFWYYYENVSLIQTSFFKSMPYVDVTFHMREIFSSLFKHVANGDANFQVRRACERHSFKES